MSNSMFDMVREELVNNDKTFKHLPETVKDKIAQRYVNEIFNSDVKKPLSAEEADKFHKLLVEEFGEKNFVKRWLNKIRSSK